MRIYEKIFFVICKNHFLISIVRSVDNHRDFEKTNEHLIINVKCRAGARIFGELHR